MKVTMKRKKEVDEGVLDLFKKKPKFPSIEDVKFKQVLNRLSTSEYNKFLRDAFKNFKEVATIEKESPYQLLLLLKNNPDVFKGIARKIRVFNFSCTLYDFWLNSFVKDVLTSAVPEEKNQGQNRGITGKEPKTALGDFSLGYRIPREDPIELFKEKPKQYMEEPEFKIPDGFLPQMEQELKQKVEQVLSLIKIHHELLVDITKPLESGYGNTMIPGKIKPPPPPPPPINPAPLAQTPPMPNPRRDNIVNMLNAKKGNEITK